MKSKMSSSLENVALDRRVSSESVFGRIVRRLSIERLHAASLDACGLRVLGCVWSVDLGESDRDTERAHDLLLR